MLKQPGCTWTLVLHMMGVHKRTLMLQMLGVHNLMPRMMGGNWDMH